MAHHSDIGPRDEVTPQPIRALTVPQVREFTQRNAANHLLLQEIRRLHNTLITINELYWTIYREWHDNRMGHMMAMQELRRVLQREPALDRLVGVNGTAIQRGPEPPVSP